VSTHVYTVVTGQYQGHCKLVNKNERNLFSSNFKYSNHKLTYFWIGWSKRSTRKSPQQIINIVYFSVSNSLQSRPTWKFKL